MTGFRMQQLSTSSTRKYTTRDKWRAVSPDDNDGRYGPDVLFGTPEYRTTMRATQIHNGDGKYKNNNKLLLFIVKIRSKPEGVKRIRDDRNTLTFNCVYKCWSARI